MGAPGLAVAGSLMIMQASLALLIAVASVVWPALAGTLVVNANTADPAPRAAWEELAARFQAENPDVELRLNIYDGESYKKSIRNWLTSAPPDVVYWNAGYRMRQFVAPRLLEDVSDLYTPAIKGSIHPSALDLVSVGGRQYGVPYTYYPIGFFYRRDLLESADVGALPQDWGGLVAACVKLKAKGIEPIAIGTGDLWPAAAWFDYLDLRLNGLQFHMELMRGAIPYTDARVARVFEYWRVLVAPRRQPSCERATAQPPASCWRLPALRAVRHLSIGERDRAVVLRLERRRRESVGWPW